MKGKPTPKRIDLSHRPAQGRDLVADAAIISSTMSDAATDATRAAGSAIRVGRFR
jgi:hypothetical protein